MLAAILCKGVSVQIKRGLCRQYITKEEPLASPRGKLEIGESIKTQVLRKKQLVCAYDEFSVNAYTNRIIKTTMAVLLLSLIHISFIRGFASEGSTIDKPRSKNRSGLLL